MGCLICAIWFCFKIWLGYVFITIIVDAMTYKNPEVINEDK